MQYKEQNILKAKEMNIGTMSYLVNLGTKFMAMTVTVMRLSIRVSISGTAKGLRLPPKRKTKRAGKENVVLKRVLPPRSARGKAPKSMATEGTMQMESTV
jgi:hypothetical protein